MINNFADMKELEKKKVVLLDIEGTTTSISFVKDKLFPYARKNLRDYLVERFDEPQTKDIINAIKKQSLKDIKNGMEGIEVVPDEFSTRGEIVSSVEKNLIGMMDADRKVEPLKRLQGLIWRGAYEDGSIKGHVYDDVIPFLQTWTEVEDKRIYIYSSGSVAAQKLLFQYSVFGNILKYFSGHFDTTIGHKMESSSYEKISGNLNLPSEDIVFITDVPKEAIAANEAGICSILSRRPGTLKLEAEDLERFPVIVTFGELLGSDTGGKHTGDEEIGKALEVTDLKSEKVGVKRKLDNVD